ncbi:MAG: urea ABC transporter permease subunit UrtB, partial [Verrucomicrobia bacterium]|nr:urea ABC transporter permease subunit UrtB [Verrucomicrobiota bacterium]
MVDSLRIRLLLLGLTFCAGLCWSIVPSAGALTPEQLKPLADDDFDAKSEAVDQIISAGDAAALRILEALDQSALYATDSGQILIQVGTSFHDALTDAPVSVNADSAQAISLSNVLRARVSRGLARVELKSPDKALREQAVNTLSNDPDPSFNADVQAAREHEIDPALRKRLDQLWAMTALRDPDPAHRAEAVNLIAQRHDPQLRTLIAPLVTTKPDGSFVEPDAGVRKAAQAAIDQLKSDELKTQWVGNAFAGLSLGSILLLAALGLAIIYGLIGVINMAHGEFLMIGAYATYVTQQIFMSRWPQLLDWYPVAALPVAFCAAAIVGLAIERLIIRFLYGRPLETLLATFGVSLILIQTVRTIFGAQNVQVANPTWMSGGIEVLPGLVLPFNRICIIIFALTVVLLTWIVLQKTKLGLLVRAVTQNRRMAACLGVKTWQVDCYAFAFGSGIAG